MSVLTRLQELNLSFGEITEAAALVVAQAVKDKAHMVKLDLNGAYPLVYTIFYCVQNISNDFTH